MTSSYLEGQQNELGAYGYNRDGKRGKLQIVIGLLADEAGEPLAVRVFEGNRSRSHHGGGADPNLAGAIRGGRVGVRRGPGDGEEPGEAGADGGGACAISRP